MSDPTPAPFDRKVYQSFYRRHDLDIHVCRVTVEDKMYVDVREFIPSLEQYGRGILIPVNYGPEIATAIHEASEQ